MSRLYHPPELTPEQEAKYQANRRAECVLMDHFSAICVRAGLSPKRTSVSGIAVYDIVGQHDDLPNLKIELLGLIHCNWGVIEVIRLDRGKEDWSHRLEVDLSDPDYHYQVLQFLGTRQKLINECRAYNSFDGLE